MKIIKVTNVATGAAKYLTHDGSLTPSYDAAHQWPDAEADRLFAKLRASEAVTEVYDLSAFDCDYRNKSHHADPMPF